MTSAIAVIRSSDALMPLGPIGSLESYLERVNRFAKLTREQELALARRWRDEHDLGAARQLVLAHLRYVVRIARGCSGYGLPIADLIQEGNVGLMKAVRRFDPEMGARLLTFAVHWIRAEIYEHILRHWRLVKLGVSKAERKLFFNLRKFKKKPGWLNQEETRALAGSLNVTAAAVSCMEQRLAVPDVPFDRPLGMEEEEVWSPCDYLCDPDSDPAALLEREQWQSTVAGHVASAIEALDERSRDILRSRWSNQSKATLHDLADRYGISAERIRQIEATAIEKLRRAVAQLA